MHDKTCVFGLIVYERPHTVRYCDIWQYVSGCCHGADIMQVIGQAVTIIAVCIHCQCLEQV